MIIFTYLACIKQRTQSTNQETHIIFISHIQYHQSTKQRYLVYHKDTTLFYKQYDIQRVHPRRCNMVYLISRWSCTTPQTSFIAYMYKKQCKIKTFHTKYLKASSYKIIGKILSLNICSSQTQEYLGRDPYSQNIEMLSLLQYFE